MALQAAGRPIVPYPTERFFLGGGLPDTSCQATVASSLVCRDGFADGSQRAIS